MNVYNYVCSVKYTGLFMLWLFIWIKNVGTRRKMRHFRILSTTLVQPILDSYLACGNLVFYSMYWCFEGPYLCRLSYCTTIETERIINFCKGILPSWVYWCFKCSVVVNVLYAWSKGWKMVVKFIGTFCRCLHQHMGGTGTVIYFLTGNHASITWIRVQTSTICSVGIQGFAYLGERVSYTIQTLACLSTLWVMSGERGTLHYFLLTILFCIGL